MTPWSKASSSSAASDVYKTRGKSQESGAKSQESGVKSQESRVRGQETRAGGHAHRGDQETSKNPGCRVLREKKKVMLQEHGAKTRELDI